MRDTLLLGVTRPSFLLSHQTIDPLPFASANLTHALNMGAITISVVVTITGDTAETRCWRVSWHTSGCNDGSSSRLLSVGGCTWRVGHCV